MQLTQFKIIALNSVSHHHQKTLNLVYMNVDGWGYMMNVFLSSVSYLEKCSISLLGVGVLQLHFPSSETVACI